MKIFRKFIKALLIFVLAVLSLMIALPFLFPASVKERVKNLAFSYIDGTIDYKDAGLSFFRHFPRLTFYMDDILLKGPSPFQNDTLISGKSISAGINLSSLLKGSVQIDGIYLDGVFLNIITDSNGKSNYNIIKASDQDSVETGSTTSGNVTLDRIRISDSRLVYTDSASGIVAILNGLNYKGKGGLKDSYFSLSSLLKIEELSFILDGTAYIDQKPLKAEMFTKINIDSMAIYLEKNRISLAGVKAGFNGNFAFTQNGYDIDFALKTERIDFRDLFTLMPSNYTQWFAETKINGKASVGIEFRGSENDSLKSSPDLSVDFNVDKGKITYAKTPVPLEKIDLKGKFVLPSLDPELMAVRIDKMSFKLGRDGTVASFEMRGVSEPYYKADITGSLDLDLLTRALGFKSMKMGGLLQYKAEIDGIYNTKKRVLPVMDLTVGLKDGMVSTTRYPGTLHDFNAEVSITDKSGGYSDLKIVADPFSFIFDGNPFNLVAKMEDFDNLKYDISSQGDLNLDNLYKLFALEGITLKGEIIPDIKLKGNQKDAKAGRYNKLENSGTIEFRNFEFMSDQYPFPFVIPQGRIVVDRDKAWLKNTEVRYRDNLIRLDGYASNFMGYYFEGGDLQGTLSVRSDSFNLDDFRFLMEGEDDTTVVENTGVVMLPDNLNLALNAEIKEVLFSGTKIQNINGGVKLNKSAVTLTNTTLALAGAKFALDASYKPLSQQKATFTMNVAGDSFDVQRAYKEIPMFREMMSTAESIYGKISLKYSVNGELDSEMSPVYPSIKGGGYIKLEDVKVKGLKVLGEISKATGRDSINNPNLKGVIIKSHIKNNIITIERTKMKVLGFRPRFEGQTSFDGKLNIRFRLGLPPLGIIGIPVTVTGTLDNPQIHLRRGRNGDILYETETETDKDL
jgi:AsmA protein